MLGTINSFVHVIMYGYYFLTSYRPELKNSMWWKKHITQIQLVSEQAVYTCIVFLFVFARSCLCCVYVPRCPLIPIWNANIFFHVSKLMLFFNLCNFFLLLFIVDSVRCAGHSLFKSNIFLWMRMVKGDFTHRCHTEYVYVYFVFGLLCESLCTKAQKGTQQMNTRQRRSRMHSIRSLLNKKFLYKVLFYIQ